MGLEKIARWCLPTAEVRGYVGGSGGVELECDESPVELRGEKTMTAGLEVRSDFEFGGAVGGASSVLPWNERGGNRPRGIVTADRRDMDLERVLVGERNEVAEGFVVEVVGLDYQGLTVRPRDGRTTVR